MKKMLLSLAVFTCLSTLAYAEPADDWLLYRGAFKSEAVQNADTGEIVMQNGLIRRTWVTTPAAACVRFDNLATGETLLRGVRPEVVAVVAGKPITVGGLLGQPNHAFMKDEWLTNGTMNPDPNTFQLADVKITQPKERFAWKRVRYLPKDMAEKSWPPAGVALAMRYQLPEDAAKRLAENDADLAQQLMKIEVTVHYEMYDGIPLMAKYFTITNNSATPITLNRFDSEILAMVEVGGSVESRNKMTDAWSAQDPCGHVRHTTPFVPHTALSTGVYSGTALANVHFESEYECIGMDAASANEVVRWEPDPQFGTQVNYERVTPCLLKAGLMRLDYDLAPGETFEAPWTYELIYDSTDRQRRGLSVQRMYRTIAPWACENPILMHVRGADEASVKQAVDQCAEVGFEMVIMTFGSGFNIEDDAPQYLEYIGNLVKYANEKGVELGGYSLLASRGVSPTDDVINPATGTPGGFARFGNSPCLGSEWCQGYFKKLYNFYEKTGFSLLEHDGSYPGDYCGSTTHPGHKGLADSQYRQWKTITDFYRWCRGQGIYLNVPDWYFLNGSSKTGMGYRETNWSLPRAEQVIHGRQNIYDGTWEKTASMGWMFVPLTQYHGGGPAATMEPLSENLADYERHLANNFGAGVQACYRGPRLYDTDETKAVVKKWVDFYKRHRDILDSDALHLRRADARDIDYLLHVNPLLEEKGLLMIYNPTDSEVTRTLCVPLYYTGLTDTAAVSHRDAAACTQYKLNRRWEIELPVTVPAGGCTWYIIR